MPHLHIKSFIQSTLPSKEEESEFLFLATNSTDKNEHLICVNQEDEKFFILAKQTDYKNLLKSDKLTRPSENYITKKALLNYAKFSKLEIISSNVNDEKQKNMHLEDSSALKKIEYFVTNFPLEKKICIEVGFGSGRHLIHQAAQNPDLLFIGIEIHKPSIEQVLKQISIQELDNVLLLDYDARLFMELVPSNIVAKIFVHFPVPWDKKERRRVINRAFLDESIRVLGENGRLELRTDSENYFTYSFATFIALQNVKLELNKNQNIAVTSKYEDRWRLQEKNIYDITMIVNEHSQELVEKRTFDFDGIPKNLDTLKELNQQTFKYENGFIHFERLYTIEDGRILFRLSMGSFDRSEHLYLIVSQSDGASYFPRTPVKTATNLQIHQHLKELLYG
ncbi:MAG: tRNA (guanosine(46)-N7)-methyltransferase TrmB [Helicobacteraceae bacterium]|nr:tRNA (guanosine(46)-N7)-methyltransferase TrmB [Helicobacteraceae bacterium]